MIGRYFARFFSPRGTVCSQRWMGNSSVSLTSRLPSSFKYSQGRRRNQRHSWREVTMLAGVAEAIYLSSTTPVKDEQHRAELKETLILQIRRSILAMRNKEYQKADELLHMALGIAQQIADKEGEVYILDLLANLYFEQGQYSKAEETFKEVLRRELSSGKPEDAATVVEISAKLAKIYAESGQKDKARAGFDFCIDKMKSLFEKLPEDKRTEVMDLYFKVVQWASEFVVNLEDKTEKSVKEGSDMIENVLKIAQDLEHNRSEAYQTLANNLSTLYAWQNRFEDAISIMKETIKLAATTEHWSLGHFYLNLASIYAGQGDLSNAENALAKAEEIGKRTGYEELLKDVERLRSDFKTRRQKI